MKYFLVLYTTALCMFHLPGRAQNQLPVKHVVLITVDGFRPDFYLDTAWHAHHIRALMAEGAYAKGVTSVFPSMTYPSHTTIVTGVQPSVHGVYYNKMYEPAGSTGKIYWNDSSIKSPTIWKAATDKGLKATALFWPVSADAPVSCNIPDMADMGDALQKQFSRPAGFIDTLQNQLFNGIPKINFGDDRNVAKIAAWVIKKDQPNLMTIHFFGVDHAEHMDGRDGPMVKEAIAAADSGIGIIMDALKAAGIWSSTTIIVTGDHGFVSVKTSVSPNTWLSNAGLLGNAKTGDWKAQFFTVGGSAWLYLKDKNDTKTLKSVQALLNRLPADQQQYFRIINRRQLDAVGANPEVALVLSGENNASFNGDSAGSAIKPGKGGSHGYIPDFYEIRTGFVAHGAGIRKGAAITLMNERDIAVVVSSLLGLDFPSAAGKLPDGLLVR
jgi:Type I phosphodiesterase / nucleotide pyrophosphatase